MRRAMVGAAMSIAIALGVPSCHTGAGSGRAAVERSTSPTEGSGAAGMSLQSPSFGDGEPIPQRHAYRGEGKNIPPTLNWSGLPTGTKELALIVDDPDAPTPQPWVHDVLYSIPIGASPLDASARLSPLAGRLRKGVNSWDELGWGGPMPPPGKAHRYIFTLYALDTELDLAEGQTKEGLLGAMEGRVLGTAKLVGTFQR